MMQTDATLRHQINRLASILYAIAQCARGLYGAARMAVRAIVRRVV